jgi:intracellular septation protein A
MAPPSLKALLVSSMRAPSCVDVEVCELVDVDLLAEPPPLDPQAAVVTRTATASLRSTRLFYPERGHVTDGVEPSAVSDDTEATEAEGSAVAEGVVVEAAGLDPIDTRTILRAGGPRFVANAGFPVLFFYLGWKMSGLLLGVILATAVGVGAYLYERHKERPGMVARLALAFVIIQGVIGLAFGSAKVYLAQPVVLNLGLGLVFLVTTLRGKPFAGSFADELYAFPPEVKESDTFKQAFARVSIVWAVYFLVRSAIRLYMLEWSVDAFVIVNVVTGFPIVAALVSWSVWYITRFFRRSEEWGPALAQS